MSRPYKQGVDYFPLDVHLDDKVKFIELKFGLEGFATYIKLLQKIYSYGYWYKWGEDEALLFANELNKDTNFVNDVIQECLKRDLFSKELYEKYEILTSRGIQKRYKEITRRRKDVEVIEEYLLIDDIKLVNDGKNTSESSQDVSKNKVLATEREIERETESESKQKVKNENEKNNYKDIFDYWVSLGIIKHQKINNKMRQKIKARLNEGYSPEYIKQTIKNYADILNSDLHYFSYKWPLDEFLQKGFEKFEDRDVAWQNYIDKSKKESNEKDKRRQILDKYREGGD